jgi:hypothetical protein
MAMIPTGWDVSTLGLGDDAAAAGEVDVPADALATEVGAAEAPGELTAGVDEQAPITTVVTARAATARTDVDIAAL